MGYQRPRSLAPMRVQRWVIRCGMLGAEPLSFVRGRRWGPYGPRGRAGTGREGAAGASVEFWSLSLHCWARRTFETVAFFSFLLHKKKNSPARLGYSVRWSQKCEAKVLFCLAGFFFFLPLSSPIFNVLVNVGRKASGERVRIYYVPSFCGTVAK